MCINQLPCQGKDKSISLLLGAGFSAPMGYPLGNQLNEKIFNCRKDEAFAQHIQYDYYFDFCKDVICHYIDYIKPEPFDYEGFCEYYKESAINDANLKKFFNDKKYENGTADFEQYLCQIDMIYKRLVLFYLKDREGQSWYADSTHLKPIFSGYTGFLNCIEELSKDYTIHVHTLNHDLFFERLNLTEWINGKLCDGFEELGSPYYGELLHKDRSCKCRLSRYIGKYQKRIRLYKLHGSIDYYRDYTECTTSPIAGIRDVVTPDKYIKIPCGIKYSCFYKEIGNKKCNLSYKRCCIDFRPDFLTGKTSKISRYKEPLLYKQLFDLFKKNLKNAEMLIIIGYGCKDKEINRYILEEFGNKKRCFIVDPCTKQGDKVYDFISRMGNNTSLVSKEIEEISLSDFKKRKVECLI